MKKLPSPITVLGSVFSIFALGVTIWLIYFSEKKGSALLDQTVYWFLIVDLVSHGGEQSVV